MRSAGAAVVPVILASMAALPALAQDNLAFPPVSNAYGLPGLVEMPSAESSPDGRIRSSFFSFDGTARGTLTFQISPRLTGAFRYSTVDEYSGPGTDRTWDRSFDLRFRLLEETRLRPAVAIGLRDFIGTGLLTGEYIAATKNLGSRVKVTGGLGWGRLGSANGFDNPFGLDERQNAEVGEGGRLNSTEWFSGDAAFFGGVQYAVTPKLTFTAEYSSDGYARESALGTFEPKSQVNLGLTWAGFEGMELSGYYLYGQEIGALASFVIDPGKRPFAGGLDPAPVPVKPRAAGAAAARSWATPEAGRDYGGRLAKVLAADGIEVVSTEITATRARVRIINTRYRAAPQAMGHTARVMSQVLPASVESFVIETVEGGYPASAVTLSRSDLEALEFAPNNTVLSYERAAITAAGPGTGLQSTGLFPRFSWGLAPYFAFSTFDVRESRKFAVGAELSGTYELTPALSLSGGLRKIVAGELSTSPPNEDTDAPNVRTDGYLYNREGDPSLAFLTVDHRGRLSPDVYTRLSVGYLEQMFGGVSGEVLWKPVDSPLALGAELNYAVKRDYDQGFGLQDYDVVTGHASAYYEFGDGYHAQLDLGRYLAGDWGGTLSLDREFANGWRIGAFVTLTDMSAEDFGEGSFDKGLRITMPVDWLIGRPTRSQPSGTIRSLVRDGGARLNLRNRIYKDVRELHSPQLQDQWGRFWR